MNIKSIILVTKHKVSHVMVLKHQGSNHLSNLSCFKYLDVFKKIITINICVSEMISYRKP